MPEKVCAGNKLKLKWYAEAAEVSCVFLVAQNAAQGHGFVVVVQVDVGIGAVVGGGGGLLPAEIGCSDAGQMDERVKGGKVCGEGPVGVGGKGGRGVRMELLVAGR